MLTARTLADVTPLERQPGCAWPGCTAHRGHGHAYCDPHRLKVARGAEPGVETPWERLLVAALRIADAETDAQYTRAAERLKAAAVAFRQAKRTRRG